MAAARGSWAFRWSTDPAGRSAQGLGLGIAVKDLKLRA